MSDKQIAYFGTPAQKRELAQRKKAYAWATTPAKPRSGAPKRKKKYKKRKGWGRGAHDKSRRKTQRKYKKKGKTYYTTKSGKRRARPRRGRKTSTTLYKNYKMGGRRRRALIKGGYLDSSGRVNPGRKRRRRRRKKNPTFMGVVRSAMSRGYIRSIAQTIVGGSATVALAAGIDTAAGGRYGLTQHGTKGVLLTAGSLVVTTMVAGYVENMLVKRGGFAAMCCTGLTKHVMLGGGLVLAARALFEFAPALANWLKLSRPQTPHVSVPGMRAAAPVGNGVGDWLQLSGGMGGLGAATSNEALIAGESFANSVNQFSGMGDAFALPMSAIRAPGQALSGYGYPGQYGMGDWMQTTNAGALAMSSFDPVLETF